MILLIIPLIALILGVSLALLLAHPITGITGQYLSVACLAGLDTVCGGIRSGLEGKFHGDVFISGFISNIIIASALAWIGDKIYIDLFLAVGLVLGARIFTNLSLIRRYLLNQLKDSRERKRLEQIAGAATQASLSNAPIGQVDPSA